MMRLGMLLGLIIAIAFCVMIFIVSLTCDLSGYEIAAMIGAEGVFIIGTMTLKYQQKKIEHNERPDSGGGPPATKQEDIG